ncbi:uncharacterized protein LOC135463366 [Liolophura sinensis]|uniref:uncharacterized protein LOC135463366 n=1 Tax=Liolophura sinensis TaxID=3198878 RepID=UPI00315936C6
MKVEQWLCEDIRHRDGGLQTASSSAGFIGPSRSQSAIAISRLLQQTGIPLIGVATTLSDLSNKTRYPNLMRTAVSDKEQSKAIISMVKRLEWSVVAILHTEDEYSRDLAGTVWRLATENNICVLHMTQVSNLRDVRLTLKALLEKQQDKTARDSLGVVHLGQRESVRQLSYILLDEYKENPDAVRKLQWIFPDSVGTDASLFNNILGPPSSQDYLQNIWSISPSSFQLHEFGDFFLSQIRDVSKGLVNATNPWLEDFVQSSCRPSSVNPGCTDFKQGDYVTSGIHAVYALSLAAKRVHEQLCAGAPGLCEAFKTKSSLDLLGEVRRICLHYADFDENHTVPELAQKNVSVNFDTNGDVKLSLEQQVYDINQFHQRAFRKVGSYRQNGSLQLKESNNPPSVCRTPCRECVSRTPFVYLPGDVLLAGFFSLHWAPNNDDPFGCGPFRSAFHAIISVEGFRYALQKFREESGINFGAVIFDDCYSSLQAVTIVTQFFSGKEPLVDPATGHVIDLSKVVAVIGSESSAVSLPLVENFRHLRIPVISPGSSSPDLDDKGLYPYMLRTCASDSVSSDVFVAILKHFGWTYVSFVYINNNYGHRAMAYTRQKAQDNGICVAEPIPIELNPDEKDLFAIVKKLNTNGAKVVLYIGVDQNANAFVRVLKYHKIDLVFVSLGDCLTFQPNLGSLAILQSRGYLPWIDFQHYLQKRKPSLTKSSAWFDTFWQQVFQCNLPRCTENPNLARCDDGLKFENNDVLSWGNNFKVRNTINAVASAMKGSVKALKFLCGPESVFKCKAFQENPTLVTKFIKDVQLGPGDRSYRPFLANGNGNLDFVIWSLQEQDDGPAKYVPVAKYSPEAKKLVMTSGDKNLKFYDKGRIVENWTSSCTSSEVCPSCEVILAPARPGIELSPNANAYIPVAILVIVCMVAVTLVVSIAVVVVRKSRRETRKRKQHLAPCVLSHLGQERELRIENLSSDSISSYLSTVGSENQLHQVPSLHGVRNVRHLERLPRTTAATGDVEVMVHDNRNGSVVNPLSHTKKVPRIAQSSHISHRADANSAEETTAEASSSFDATLSRPFFKDVCGTNLKTVEEEDDTMVLKLLSDGRGEPDVGQTNTVSVDDLDTTTSTISEGERPFLGTSRETPEFEAVNPKDHPNPQLPETFL